jgi:hypothetical protein
MTALDQRMPAVDTARPRRRLFGPGWPPAIVCYLLTTWGLSRAGIPIQDTLIFSAYVVGCLALPGTLAWRCIAGDAARPFVADVVFGTGLAYAIELAAYLPARAAGTPRLVLAWPAIVIGLSLLPRWRRTVWRQGAGYRLPLGWCWAMTGIVLLALLWVWRHLLWPSPVTPAALRFPYVDEPYHLSLVAEVRHHMPVGSPVVDGEPLYYHWFVHAHVAASSWVTGIEPAALLQGLTFVPMIVLILVGSALLAGSLARSMSLGLLAPVILVAGGADLTHVGSGLFLTAVLYLSPTTTFAQMLLVPTIALSVAMLSRQPAPRPGGTSLPAWLAVGLLFGALAGAKATVIPVVASGYLAVALLAAVHRRLDRRALVLFGLAATAMLLAVRLLYGGQSRGLRLEPLRLAELRVFQAGLAADATSAPTWLALVFAIAGVGALVAGSVGMLGLACHGRWRDPRAQFLVISALAGATATFVFAQNAFGQAYFLRTTPVLFAITGAWGFAAMIPRHHPRQVLPALFGSLLGGAVLATVVHRLVESARIGLGRNPSLLNFLAPALVVGTALAAAAVVSLLVTRRSPAWRGVTAPLLAGAVLGLTLPSVVSFVADVAENPLPTSYVTPPESQATIGRGGIDAAHWLRAHSAPDQLVATNAHCRSSRSGCDNRMFWLAAYSERGVLVEGWSYQARTQPRAEALGMRACCLPFWDPKRLLDNDAAFMARTSDSVRRLRDRYGVRWLMVDQRSPHRLRALSRQAEVRYKSGQYVVLEIPPR